MSFVLKNPKSKDKTLIVCTYYFNGRVMKFSTREKVHPDDWNANKRRARSSAERSAVLNKYLDRLESRIKDIHLDMRSNFEDVTPYNLRQAVERDLKMDGRKESFSQFIIRFIDESKATRKKGSLQVYQSMQKVFKNYVGAKEFEDITPQWFERFQGYMERSGYSANYIGKTVAIIRELITVAKKRGLTRNEVYKVDYRKPREEVQDIYLTEHELLKMYGAPKSKALDNVTDRFMIGAFTCLRFSDNSTITLDNIRNGMIYDRNAKTKEFVVVPMHWVVKQIMDAHPDGLPPAVSNQKANKYLKKIGKIAGIDQPVTMSRTVGGKVIETTKPKYEFIKTHTARRSAATNMSRAGIPRQAIMKIGGWKTESSFGKYLKLTQEENAIDIAGHEYFTSPF